MPHYSAFRRATFAGLVLFLTLLIACKKAATTADAGTNSLTIVQGNFQSAQAGLALPTPIVLRVTAAAGTGVENVPVTLVVSDGGGAVNPASGKTDVRGEIKASWTLGPSSASQSLIASTPGSDAVRLQAFGILPSDIIIAQGNSQTAKVAAPVPNVIVVRIVGPGNVAMHLTFDTTYSTTGKPTVRVPLSSDPLSPFNWAGKMWEATAKGKFSASSDDGSFSVTGKMDSAHATEGAPGHMGYEQNGIFVGSKAK